MDREGAVWVGTPGAGLARYESGQFAWLHKTDGLVSDAVTSLLEDHEGSLWIGTQNGLSELTDVKFPIYSAREGLPGTSVVSVFSGRKGGLWITTERGLSYLDKQNITVPTNAVFQQWFKRVFESRNGDLYLVNDKKQILVISNGAVKKTYDNPSWPSAMTEDTEGPIVGVGDKIFRIRNERMMPYAYADGAEPAYYWVVNLAVGTVRWSIWVASNNGIFRLRNGVVRRRSMTEGLSDNNVFWVFEDIDGAVWAGLPSGIARIKGDQVKSITPEHGLADNNIYEIVPDDRGNFWMDSVAGILRASRKSLNDFADGKTNYIECEVFDSLESIKFTGHTKRESVAGKTAHGRIWFPNPLGLAMIDPAHLLTNSIVPPVRIEQIRINGIESRAARFPNSRWAAADGIPFHRLELFGVAKGQPALQTRRL